MFPGIWEDWYSHPKCLSASMEWSSSLPEEGCCLLSLRWGRQGCMPLSWAKCGPTKKAGDGSTSKGSCKRRPPGKVEWPQQRMDQKPEIGAGGNCSQSKGTLPLRNLKCEIFSVENSKEPRGRASFRACSTQRTPMLNCHDDFALVLWFIQLFTPHIPSWPLSTKQHLEEEEEV